MEISPILITNSGYPKQTVQEGKISDKGMQCVSGEMDGNL